MKNLAERMPKDLLKWTAAGFALAATATAEYEIAREIGMNEWIAAAVPGALDAYVVRALRTHREVLTSVAAMVGVNAASHLVTAGILPVEWPLITAVSAIAPLVLWRVHALGTPGEWRQRKIWGLSKAEHAAVLASTEPEHTSTEVCVCGDPIERWTGPGEPGWVHSPGSDTPCLAPITRAEYIASTRGEPEHTEHDRAPDNPEPPGTREHPEHTAAVMCPLCGWGCPADVLGKHIRKAHPKRFEHTASTDQERVRAQTDAWGDDWLDVHDAVHAPSTPPVPVHAPYADHVHVEHADPGPVLLPFLPSTQPVKARHLEVVPDPGELDGRDGVTGYVDETVHAPDPVCENCGHAGHGEHRHDGRPWAADALRDCPLCSCAQELREMCGYCAETEHTPFACPCTDGNPAACPVHEIEHTASTRTADDWNLEHVSTGTLTPEDTEHMERARELFHTIGGMPPFRALKHGTPGMGTDRAKRIRAALEIENKGTD